MPVASVLACCLWQETASQDGAAEQVWPPAPRRRKGGGGQTLGMEASHGGGQAQRTGHLNWYQMAQRRASVDRLRHVPYSRTCPTAARALQPHPLTPKPCTPKSLTLNSLRLHA